MVEQYFMINAVRTALYDENFGDYNEKVRVRVTVFDALGCWCSCVSECHLRLSNLATKPAHQC